MFFCSSPLPLLPPVLEVQSKEAPNLTKILHRDFRLSPVLWGVRSDHGKKQTKKPRNTRITRIR